MWQICYWVVSVGVIFESLNPEASSGQKLVLKGQQAITKQRSGPIPGLGGSLSQRCEPANYVSDKRWHQYDKVVIGNMSTFPSVPHQPLTTSTGMVKLARCPRVSARVVFSREILGACLYACHFLLRPRVSLLTFKFLITCRRRNILCRLVKDTADNEILLLLPLLLLARSLPSAISQPEVPAAA